MVRLKYLMNVLIYKTQILIWKAEAANRRGRFLVKHVIDLIIVWKENDSNVLNNIGLTANQLIAESHLGLVLNERHESHVHF